MPFSEKCYAIGFYYPVNHHRALNTMKINPQIGQIDNVFALMTDSNPTVVNDGFNLTLGPPVAVTKTDVL